MRWGIILALLLAGCAEKESAKLERQVDMMKKAGATSAELCTKEREIADAYLREENAEEYDLKKLSADVRCNQAATDRL
jgi:hypothetical protein